MKLHRHIALLEVSHPTIIDALESTHDWRKYHLRRVSENAVALSTEHVETVAAKLRDLGYLPRVIER